MLAEDGVQHSLDLQPGNDLDVDGDAVDDVPGERAAPPRRGREDLAQTVLREAILSFLRAPAEDVEVEVGALVGESQAGRAGDDDHLVLGAGQGAPARQLETPLA